MTTREAQQRVRKELAARLRGEPNPFVWDLLVKSGKVDEVADGIYLIADLLGDYDDYMQVLAKHEGRWQGTIKRHAPLSRELPPDESLQALSEIMALEAAEEPYVVLFRDMMLGDGQLLTAVEAAEFLEMLLDTRVLQFQRPLHAGTPTRDPLGWSRLRPRPTPWESELAVQAHLLETISLNGKNFTTREAIEANEADYDLDFLYCLVDVLSWWYGWQNDPGEQIVLFLLTGRVPEMRGTELRFEARERFPNAGNVTMHIDPRTSPREVMAAYSEFRGSSTGHLPRDTSITNCL